MIVINLYEPQLIEHFDSENNFLGCLNEWESLDLRCQIAQNQLEGYYLLFNNQKIMINKDGQIKNWATGMYDTNEKLLSKLFKIRKKIL